MDTFGERLSLFIQNQGITQAKFAELTGFTADVISSYVNNKNKPSLKKLTELVTPFPNLNVRWLLTGQGEMLLSKVEQSPDSEQRFRDLEGKVAALYDVIGQALNKELGSVEKKGE